jgi:hypothetical protein
MDLFFSRTAAGCPAIKVDVPSVDGAAGAVLVIVGAAGADVAALDFPKRLKPDDGAVVVAGAAVLAAGVDAAGC